MSSTELKPIILYDIPCITPGRPWSPNTMKTRHAFDFLPVVVAVQRRGLIDNHHFVRYCLGYKRLPFTTVWVEFPDIAGLVQSKGIIQPPYTLPAIEDPNTGAFIMDSLAIATYLDETYPEAPKVLTPAARAVLERVGDVFSFGSGGSTSAGAGAGADVVLGDGKTDGPRDLAPRLVFIILAGERLNPVSKAYYYHTRAARLGEQWTTLINACLASPEDRAERVRQGIEAIRGTWRRVTALYVCQSDPEQGTSGAPFGLGEEPCLFDFAVAGRVKFALDALTLSEAETLKNLEGGRLWKLVDDLEKYYFQY